MKKRYFVGIMLSIIFSYFAFKNVDISEFFDILKNIKYGYTFPIAFLIIGGFVLRAFRWKYLIEPVKVVNLNKLFSSTMIGFMANNILPVRLGEIVRAYSIGKMENISKSSAFATIVVERVLDVFFVIILFLLLLFLFPLAISFPADLIKNGYIIFIFAIFFLIFLLFIMLKKELILNLVERVLRSFPEKISKRVHRIVDSFIKGLDFFRDTHHFIPLLLLSIAMWSIYLLSYYFAFLSFGFFDGNYYTYFLAGAVLLVLGSIGLMIPSAPGAIGTFHTFCILGFFIVGMRDKNQAAAFAVFYHGVSYIVVTIVGLIYFLKENMHLSEMGIEDEKS
ncbi:lysylphosphatidylglycerol synthase transmembrane domain-containing protein [candidate division KSB1 bacterium]